MSTDNTQNSITELAQQVLLRMEKEDNVPECVSNLYDLIEWQNIRKCLLISSEISRLDFLSQNIAFRIKYNKDQINLSRQNVENDFNSKLAAIQSQRNDNIQKQNTKIAQLKATFENYLQEISETNLTYALEQEILLQKEQELKREKELYETEYNENQNQITKLEYLVSGFEQLLN